MEAYDETKIGKPISRAADHTVYHYASDRVIKFSRLEYILGRRAKGRVEQDLEICRKFFGHYLLETTILRSPDGKRTALVQPFIAGEYLEKKHLSDSELARQFYDIIERLNKLTTVGYGPLDLIGQGGAIFPCLSNIFVVNDNRLRIIDTTILDPRDLGFWTVILKPIVS